MANNLPQIQADLKQSLGTNLDATTITNARTFIPGTYLATQYQAYLAANSLTDSNANKDNFIVKQAVDHILNLYKAGSVMVNQAAVPAPSQIT